MGRQFPTIWRHGEADFIQGDEVKPTNKNNKEWEAMHRKVVAIIIRQWVDQSIFHYVAKETKADVLWKKLESMYER